MLIVLKYNKKQMNYMHGNVIIDDLLNDILIESMI